MMNDLIVQLLDYRYTNFLKVHGYSVCACVPTCERQGAGIKCLPLSLSAILPENF